MEPMQDAGQPDVTKILQQIGEGDAAAAERLLPLVYDQLRGIASRIFRAQRADHTLQPTALVHEAYMKMASPGSGGASDFRNRAHFLGVAARAMRQILVNHARDKGAIKRGGGRAGHRVTLSDLSSGDGVRELDLLEVHEELEALGRIDPRQARVAELRFFAGLTLDEVAEVLGVSRRTVGLEWKLAKTWFLKRIDKR